jgi:uridine kinase
MQVRPVQPALLAAELVATIMQRDGSVRVGVDGPPTAGPADLARAVVEALRTLGRFAVHVPADGFYRAASLRLERGRTNPDAFYEDWFDLGALSREVLDPLAPGGTGQVLPSLWNPATDRATRARYITVPAGGVVVVSGPLLLGTGLDLDLTVHLAQSTAALARRLPEDWQWTIPAYERYAAEVMPELIADFVVRADDPAHPAIVE